ncbi:hypothetical protein ACKKBG_A24795 [Auxenochlorella protothecoides x Auxenochlorella symbiontica]
MCFSPKTPAHCVSSDQVVMCMVQVAIPNMSIPRQTPPCSPSNVVSSARAQATLGMLAARQRGLARRAEPVPLIPPAVQARLSRLAELRAEAAALLSAPPLPLIASH